MTRTILEEGPLRIRHHHYGMFEIEIAGNPVTIGAEILLKLVCKAYLHDPATGGIKTTDLNEREAMIALLAGETIVDFDGDELDIEAFTVHPISGPFSIVSEKLEKIERLRLDETKLTAQDYNKINQLIDGYNRLLEERG